MKGLDVTELPGGKGFKITYIVESGKGRPATRTFVYGGCAQAEHKRNRIDATLIYNLLSKKILGEKTKAVLYNRKPKEIKSELVATINRIFKCDKTGKHLQENGFGQPREQQPPPPQEEEQPDPTKFPDQDLPRESIFKCELESANTKVFLAPSFSGKTTLLVTELNKLTPKELEEYDKIVLFTESTAAAPLKLLDKRVLKKMMIYDRFVPQLVRIFKKINTITKNRFRFLLLMDDRIDLKGGLLIKLILTLRNANISTVICIQYSKLLSRSQRQSIHDYYMMNMKLEDLEYLMSGFLAPHFRELFEAEGTSDVNKMNYRHLAEKAKERLKNKILHFDQRHDSIEIFNRPKK
jgi:hypothetical protein